MGGAKRYPSSTGGGFRCAALYPPYESNAPKYSMLGHHAPLGDHGLAHLPGVLRAGDFVDLDGNFLADEILELRGLGVAAGHELERLRSGFEIAQPVRRRQPARFAGDLVGGGGALALLATLHGVEFTG